MDRRTKIALVVLGAVLVVAAPVVAETFLSSFGQSRSPIHHQTDGGLEVVTQKDYEIRSGNPFTDDSFNLSTRANGWLNVSTTGTDGSVTVDEINGTWTNVSSITAPPSANISLDPSDKTVAEVGRGIDRIKFRAMGGGAGETGVNDGEVDFIYSASSEGTIVVHTNATQGTAYGMVNADTNAGLDVATADANGRIVFDEAPSETDTEVRIEELGTLTIREETAPHDKITTAIADIKFFEDDEDDPTNVQRTDDDNDGEIDLAGIPVDEQFVVQLAAAGYHNRTVLIDDLAQQKSAFLISRSRSTLENRFVVNDRTGNFPPEDSELIIQRAINRSEYGGSTAGFSWTNVGGDDLGADEAFVIDLEEETRYRIQVRNEAGDTRVLGSYTPETIGTINLNIGSIVVDPEALDTVGWSANRTNATGQPVQVTFEYNDTTDNTTRIWLHIYEYGNESNELLANTSFDGPFGQFSNTENVPDAENNTEWVVDFVAERAGESVHAEVVVGGQRDVLTDMPPWLVTIIFLGTMWSVAGVSSQLNGHIGGLVVAGLGAMFWFAGFAPPYLGGGVVALSLITAAILFIRERGGGGL